MNLFEIGAKYRENLSSMIEQGMSNEMIADQLDALQGDLKLKIRNVIAFALEIEGEAEIKSQHAKRLSESAARLAADAERLRQYAKASIEFNRLIDVKAEKPSKLVFEEFTISLQKNPGSVSITNLSALPPEYMTTPVMPAAAPDKKKIKEELAEGVIIPGAEMAEPTYRMVVR